MSRPYFFVYFSAFSSHEEQMYFSMLILWAAAHFLIFSRVPFGTRIVIVS